MNMTAIKYKEIMNDGLNKILKEVINEARGLNIPVPDNICSKVDINSRPKKRFGCCKKNKGIFYIEVSRFLLDSLGYGNRKVREVIAHEVLHTCPECYSHGIKWKNYSDEMNRAYGYNIKRVSSFEEMGLSEMERERNNNIKYIIKCNKCGKEYPRQRVTCVMKKINAYRCSCGGKLSVMEFKDINQKEGCQQNSI